MRTPDDIGSLLYLPEGPRDLGRLLERSVEAYRPAIIACAETFLTRPSADGLLEFEEEVLRLFMKTASQIVAGAVACVQIASGFVEAAVAGARERAGRRLRNQGLRMTPIRFLGGARLLLRKRAGIHIWRRWPGSPMLCGEVRWHRRSERRATAIRGVRWRRRSSRAG